MPTTTARYLDGIDRYAEMVPEMPSIDLLAELSSCVRQNYWIYGDRIAILETEILRRMSN